MKRIISMLLVISIQHVSAQSLTFLFRNPQIVSGPKFQYEVWVRSSNGTSRMGSILIYNNYSTAAFGSNVVANNRVTVTRNATAFGATYGQNLNNDNTSSRFAHSWTFLGTPGAGTVIPSAGDGVLAYTVALEISNTSASAALSFQGSLMSGEQYFDDESTTWPMVDATDVLDDPLPIQWQALLGYGSMQLSSA